MNVAKDEIQNEDDRLLVSENRSESMNLFQIEPPDKTDVMGPDLYASRSRMRQEEARCRSTL